MVLSGQHIVSTGLGDLEAEGMDEVSLLRCPQKWITVLA